MTLVESRPAIAEYNYEHFRPIHLREEVHRIRSRAGVAPGDVAPDFELPRVGGGSIRLSELRGKLVLLHFSSYT